MRPFRALLPFALVVSASCGGDTASPDGLVMSVALDQRRVTMDDSVRVTLAITNVSAVPRTVTAPDGYGMCMHAFRVISGDMRAVTVQEALCALVDIVGPQPLVLAPGQTVSARDFWKPAESLLDGRQIPPGDYHLFGRYVIDDGVLEGRPIAVEVLP
jgi:hypothetical protein